MGERQIPRTKEGFRDRRYMSRDEAKQQKPRETGALWCPLCERANDTKNEPYCHDCVTELHKANGTTPPVSIPSLTLAARLKRYGLSTSRYQYLLMRQDNACAICKRPQATTDALLVDHNHATGEVRGLLCGPCNTALGLLQDSPDVLDAALQYLEERGCYGPNALAEEA